MIEKANSLKNWLIHFSLLAFGAAFVLLNVVDVIPLLILLISFSYFLENKTNSLDKDDKLLITVLLLYFIIGVFDTTLRWQNISNMDLFFRYAVGAWFIYYLAQRKLHVWVLWLGFLLGAISVGIYAIYAKIQLGMVRVESNEFNAIRFGNYSLLLGFFCLAGVFWANQLKHKKIMIFLMLTGSLLGIIASILSGTRSGWVSYPMVLATMVLFFYDHFPRKYVIASSVACITIILVLIAIPQTNVQGRIKETIHNIEVYQQGHSSTSVGLRFEMWKSGLNAFMDKPIFGWGEEAFRQQQEKLVRNEGLNQLILTFSHTHNQYIEELAKRGIIGLLSFCALLIVPFRLFMKRMHSSSDSVRALALAGIALIICTFDFNFTQAMQRVNSGVMFFVFNLVFIWAAMRSEERARVDQNPN